jgi:hypothetical protein
MESTLTVQERLAMTKAVAKRYQRATKKERGRMLDEFCATTGYNRAYAAYKLHNMGRKVHMTVKGVRTVFVFGEKKRSTKRRSRRIYDDTIKVHLERLWALADGLCGKLLAVWIRTTLPRLEHFEEIVLDGTTREKLLAISPATIDRLLTPVRAKSKLKGRSRTKPGTLLKHQIPIRTFSDWDDARPGFVEIDLVSHDGGILEGDNIHTLDVTDVCTAWTETQAVKNKAQRWVFDALQTIIPLLPFPLLGIDSDNGSEFINNHLKRFCEEHQLTFTRSRPYRKNDSCFVEQKNWSVVRRTVGYYRYDTPEELLLLEELYRSLRLYTNFFQPVMKLKTKTRIGAKVIKTYDSPCTPFQRVLEHSAISEQHKQLLRDQYQLLNPAELKRIITRFQNKLFAFTEKKLLHNKHRKSFEQSSTVTCFPL